MNIELSQEEVEVLRKILEHEISEINPEIHHSATYVMRDELKQHREALKSLFERLGGSGE
jgi:hypothetical protein